MFKKSLAVAMIAVMTMTGCADNKNLPISKDDVSIKSEVQTYGLFDRESVENPCVTYELSWGNIIWSVVLIETIVVPIYMVGFSLYEPVSVDRECINNTD